ALHRQAYHRGALHDSERGGRAVRPAYGPRAARAALDAQDPDGMGAPAVAGTAKARETLSHRQPRIPVARRQRLDEGRTPVRTAIVTASWDQDFERCRLLCETVDKYVSGF